MGSQSRYEVRADKKVCSDNFQICCSCWTEITKLILFTTFVYTASVSKNTFVYPSVSYFRDQFR